MKTLLPLLPITPAALFPQPCFKPKPLRLLKSVVFSTLILCINGIASQTFAHGTIIKPESRIYKCRFRGSVENHADPACRAAIDLGGTQAIYDWNAVRQGSANGQHQSLIPNGELCGGGNPIYKGMNLARDDWRTSEIAPDANGMFEFVYYGTAPHATQDWIFYVTKADWVSGTPIRWDNIDEFCRLGDVPLMQDEENRNVYRLSCQLPERSGDHVIFNVWQRSDSPEAFYACSDVKFEGGSVDPDPDPTPDTSEAVCIPIETAGGKMAMICI